MELCEWAAPEGNPGQCCVHPYAFYPIHVFHLSFNFLCLLLLLNIYLSDPPSPLERTLQLCT